MTASVRRGCLIVVDGGNGAGKGTCLKEIEAHLRAQGRDVVMTREPGGTAIGERIRELLLDKAAFEMQDVTELLLFAASRAQLVREKIIPAIAAGQIVVSDRFDSATVSFQHYGRGLPLALIRQLNDIALDGLKPDLSIILDLDPATGLQRVASRGSELDRMEQENLDFLCRARQGFLEQARQDPQRFAIIDASQPREKVLSEALGLIDGLLARLGC